MGYKYEEGRDLQRKEHVVRRSRGPIFSLGYLLGIALVVLVIAALHQNYKRPQEVEVCSKSNYHLWCQASTFGARPALPYLALFYAPVTHR
jgi:hypothetical protein